MKNPENFYYKATEEQGEIAYERAQRSGRSIDEIYEQMGIEKVSANESDNEPVELTESEKAASLLEALKLDLRASKLSGLTTAIESSHPKTEGRFNSDRIDVNTSRERIYRSCADEAFRRAMGSKALSAAGYVINDVSEEHLAYLPDQFYHDFTGKENAAKRTQLRRKLTKIIKQDN